GRLRSWTAKQKARIVAESCAERRGPPTRANSATAVRWRRKAEQGGVQIASADGLEFASIAVAAPSQPERHATPAIEVVVGALTVRVPVGVDLPTLQVVLRAARGVS
ncbi:MAG TPA: hypothetical protein VGO08_15980, partial [Burkholderiales bacterium]|nr:hypothetical protein [Burkholderiales bacterium]